MQKAFAFLTRAPLSRRRPLWKAACLPLTCARFCRASPCPAPQAPQRPSVAAASPLRAREREAGTARCASEQKDTQTQLAGGSHATPSPPRGPLTPIGDRSEPAGRPRRAHARALAQTPASSQGSRPPHPTPHVQRSPQSASLAPLARAAGTARTECVMPEKVGRGDGQRQVVRQRKRCDGDRSAGGRGSRLLRRGACSTLSAVSAVTWLRHGCCLLSLSAYAGTRPTAAVRGRTARLKGCLAGWPAALAACCRHSAASATQGAPGKVPRVTAQCTAVAAAAQLGGGWQAAGPRAARKSVWRRASEVAPGTHHVISVTHHVRAIVCKSPTAQRDGERLRDRLRASDSHATRGWSSGRCKRIGPADWSNRESFTNVHSRSMGPGRSPLDPAAGRWRASAPRWIIHSKQHLARDVLGRASVAVGRHVLLRAWMEKSTGRVRHALARQDAVCSTPACAHDITPHCGKQHSACSMQHV